MKLSCCAILLLLTLCLLPACADVAPDRLLLLRGALAWHEGRAEAAASDLREAAALRLEDWRCQMLYGQALAAAGKRALAEDQLRRAILLAPNRLEPWRALSQFAQYTNNATLELFALDGLLRFFPDNPPLLRRQADLYTKLQQPVAAARALAAWENSLPPMQLDAEYLVGSRKASLQELRMIAQENANHPTALPALATEEWKGGNRDAALAILQRVIKQRPNDPAIINSYAHACFVMGRSEDALQVLRTATPLGNYGLDRALANWSISLGKYAEAKPSLQRMLMRDPVNAALNRQLGVTALLAGDTTTALEALRVSWMKLPDPVTAQHYVTAYDAADRAKEGEELLLRAIGLFPQDTILKLMLTLRYRDTDRMLQCAQLTQELSKSRPDTVPLLLLAGERFLAGGYLNRAYEQAVALRDANPTDVTAVQGAMRLFSRLVALPEARQILTRYLGPNYRGPAEWADIMLEITGYALENNQQAEAETALKQLLQSAPNTRLAYLMMGRLREQQRQWNEALKVYSQALTRWPEDGDFLLAQARAARKAGNYALALISYTQARRVVPDAAPWLEAAEIHHIQGDEAHARELWLAAQEHGGGVRSRLALLISYEGAGEADKATTALADLKTYLAAERDRKLKDWQTLLASDGLSATPDELNTLLLMAPDLIDPEPLQHWRKPEPVEAGK